MTPQSREPDRGANSGSIHYLWHMQELLQKLRDIELKIKTLGERYEILKQQNKQLKHENISLKQDLDQLSQDKLALTTELESAKSQTILNKQLDEERESTKKLLGTYIREVDKCIGLMQDVS
jgi:chromosome segregation ATPase